MTDTHGPSNSHNATDAPRFRKGDRVVEVLTGAGYTTREEATILRVSKGIAYVDNGPGNDPTPYDAATGRYDSDFGGFSRRIEHADA